MPVAERAVVSDHRELPHTIDECDDECAMLLARDQVAPNKPMQNKDFRTGVVILVILLIVATFLGFVLGTWLR